MEKGTSCSSTTVRGTTTRAKERGQLTVGRLARLTDYNPATVKSAAASAREAKKQELDKERNSHTVSYRVLSVR